jgi:PAS domain S-box-containing protein
MSSPRTLNETAATSAFAPATRRRTRLEGAPAFEPPNPRAPQSRTEFALRGWAQTRKALVQSNARLRAILEAEFDAIITFDADGIIQSVNSATVALFGYDAEELLGQSVMLLLPPPDADIQEEHLAQLIKPDESQITVKRELKASRKNGDVFPVDLALCEVEAGRLFTGIVRDISDRKLGESRMREADRLASIGVLAAGLGHDMSNVLLPVRAHLNALKVAGSAESERRKQVGRIERSIAYLQQLADGLHYLALDPDQIGHAGGITDLRLWWMQTGSLLSKAVPKHVKVMTSISNDLPSVTIAPHALTQAVLNLIVNAGEAIPVSRKRRQGIVRVRTELGPGRAYVKLCVSDNGHGMTDEVKRRAFEMFYTTKPRGLGTGLGLAMVRRAVERAGGTIEVESSIGDGATVALVLPAIESDRVANQLAVVRIANGRAASLVKNLLKAIGAQCNVEDTDAEANVWIVDPSPSNLADATTWKAQRPHGCLVVFGEPDHTTAHAWHALDAIMFNSLDDFEAVRATLANAIAMTRT